MLCRIPDTLSGMGVFHHQRAFAGPPTPRIAQELPGPPGPPRCVSGYSGASSAGPLTRCLRPAGEASPICLQRRMGRRHGCLSNPAPVGSDDEGRLLAARARCWNTAHFAATSRPAADQKRRVRTQSAPSWQGPISDPRYSDGGRTDHPIHQALAKTALNFEHPCVGRSPALRIEIRTRSPNLSRCKDDTRRAANRKPQS